MDKKLLTKKIKEALKYASKNFYLEGLNFLYAKESFNIYYNERAIGYLAYHFLTDKFISYGAICGFEINCSLNDGKVFQIIKDLKLSYNGFGNIPNFYYSCPSSEFYNNKFFKNGGVISFFQNENSDEKINELMRNLNNLYSPRISNISLAKMDAISNILSEPNRYGYPAASIIVICYLNNCKDLLSSVLKEAKSKRLYDSSDIKTNEVINKLELYLLALSGF